MNNRVTTLIKHPRSSLLLLIALVGISRWATQETYISGIDPGNYLLAMEDYSMAADRPHPPGYPVYIALCKAARLITPSAHAGILLIVILLSMGSVYSLYKVTEHLSNQKTALFAAMLLACNPLFWMYGSVAENYVADAFFSSLMVLVILKANGRMWLIAGFVFGIACGVRSTSPVLLSPVLLLILWYRFRSAQLKAAHLWLCLVGMVTGLCIWLPWVVLNEGGVARYIETFSSLSANNTGTFIGNITGFVVFAGWCLNLGALYIVLNVSTLWKSFNYAPRSLFNPTLILLAWVLPPALFFLLILYAKGYMLLFLPALCIVLALTVMNDPNPVRKRVAPFALVGFSMAVFLFTPYSQPPVFTTLSSAIRTSEQRAESVIGRAFSAYLPSLSRIRANDAQVISTLELLDGYLGTVNSKSVVIVDPSAEQFIHPRVAQFYFPDYYFVELEGEQKANIYHGIDKTEYTTLVSPFPGEKVILLSQNGMEQYYNMPELTRISKNEYVTLWEVPDESKRKLRSRVYELFVKK